MDAVPYGTADESCPQVPLPPAMGAGLSSCLLEGRLSFRGSAVNPSVFDIDALRAVEYALLRRSSVLICPADPLFPLSSLVAAAAHVDAIIRNWQQHGSAAPSPLRIGVVTTDPHSRGFYRSIAVSHRPGAGGVPMRSIVPAATVGVNGRLSVIDRDDGLWSSAFVDSVAAAHRLPGLDLLVVDLPVPDAEKLSNLNIPAVVVARDPADPTALRLAGTMPAFGYDWAVREGVDLDAEVMGPGDLRLANGRRKRIRVVPVVAPSICADAGLFWGDVSALTRLGRRSRYVGALVSEAFGLFHDLLGLAMPVATYEQLCGKSLTDRVGALAQAAKIIADTELRDEWLPMVEAELAGLLGALRAGDRITGGPTAHAGYATKAATLRPVIAEALDNGKDVLLVARTALLARLYAQYLRDRMPTVRVASLGELARSEPADVALLLGSPPTWGRWVYRSGIGRDFVVLAYTPQTHAEVSPPHGGADQGTAGRPFDELAMVAAAVRMQTAAGLRISLPEQRTRACDAVRSGAGDGAVQPSRTGQTPGAPEVTVTLPRPPEVPPGLWDGAGWTARVEPTAVSASEGRSIAEVGPGMRVTFSDGTWVWLREDSVVWRWRAHGGRTEPAEANRIKVGDDLVFIDDDAHKTLLAKILEVAEDVPELAVAGAWVGHWRATLTRAHARSGSYASLARHLMALGCGVQSQTVRLWCIGATIGPDDPQDVRRVGELLDDPVLAVRYADVWRAMQTLRHAHMRLGRRLASLVRSLGPAAGNGHLPADEILDRASGLTAADVETAVVTVRVVGIEHVGAVPAILTGLRRGGDEPVDPIIRSVLDEERQ